MLLMNRDITPEKKEKPVEIIPNTNSTGIISSIRDRLSTQQKDSIIEITDTLSDVEDEDIISNSNSMSLISKDEYNAVFSQCIY